MIKLQLLNETRIKRIQILTTSNRFHEIWTDYNTLQELFRWFEDIYLIDFVTVMFYTFDEMFNISTAGKK